MNKYRIRADEWNWTVFEQRVAGEVNKVTGQPTKDPGAILETPVAYCRDFEHAAEWIYTREARRKAELLPLVDAFKAAKAEAIAAVREVKAATV